jgi:putative chitinase
MITIPQMRAIMPMIGGRAALFVDPINSAMEEFEINTAKRQAAFLAQLAHESGQFRYMEEIASGAAYDDRKDLGNTKPEAIAVAYRHGTTPGRWWKGHGPIQITGYDNHRACSVGIFGDEYILVDDPKRITTPDDGCRAAAWFWKTHGLNDLADVGYFLRITRRINGGLNGLEERQKFYETAKGAIA